MQNLYLKKLNWETRVKYTLKEALHTPKTFECAACFKILLHLMLKKCAYFKIHGRRLDIYRSASGYGILRELHGGDTLMSGDFNTG